MSPAVVQVELYNAYCADCCWGRGPVTDEDDAQRLVDEHNIELHDALPPPDSCPACGDTWRGLCATHAETSAYDHGADTWREGRL